MYLKGDPREVLAYFYVISCNNFSYIVGRNYNQFESSKEKAVESEKIVNTITILQKTNRFEHFFFLIEHITSLSKTQIKQC